MRTLSKILGLLVIGMALVSLQVFAHEFEGVHVYAHRGAGFEYDENTIAACKQSYEQGIRGFEVDIRLSQDHELVLMHDAAVKRTTGEDGKVEAMKADQLVKLRTQLHGQPVPRFRELVAYFKDKSDARFLLELKTSDTKVYTEKVLEIYVKRLLEEVKELPKGSYWFTSFDSRVLALVKEALPEVHTGYLTGSAPTPEMIRIAKELGCSRLSISLDLTTRKYVREAKEAGLHVSLYPIRSIEDGHLAVAMGTHILCTDVPSELLKD